MKTRNIITSLILCFCISLPAFSQQSTREREQQFTYYWYAARQAMQDQQYDRAYMLLLQCEQLNPQDASTCEKLGMLYYGTNRKFQASQYLSRAFELDPGACWRSYYGLIQEVMADDEKNLYNYSRFILKRAAEADPKQATIWENLISNYIMTDEWDNALDAIDHAEALRGADERFTETRYKIHSYLRKPKKALACLDDYLSIDPDNVNILRLKIEELSRQGAPYKKMRPLYDHYIDLNPYADAGILNNFAWMLAEKKIDLDYAETLALRAITEDPENPTYLDTYAWVLYLEEKKDMARYFINQAARYISPNDPSRKIIMKHQKTINKQK